MTNKILLFILTVLLLYIGSEIFETRNVVIKANNPYSKKEIEFTKYGPSKKTTNKKENLNIKATLSGHIDKDMSYSIEVSYIATLDQPYCKKHTMWNGIVFKSKSFIYSPRINGTKHTINVPLKKINPKKGCQYKVVHALIYIYERDNKRKGRRYVLFSNNTNEFLTRGFRAGAFDFLDDRHQEIIDIECLNPSTFTNEYYYPCGYKPLKNRFSFVKRIPPKGVHATYNISTLPLETLDKDTVGYIIDGKLYNQYQRKIY